MRWRVAATVAFGLLIGAWAYLDIRLYDEQGALHTALQEPAVVIGLLALAVLTGVVVGRGWVLLALIAPVAARAHLQGEGYRGPDGIEALSSPPSIAILIWFGLMLLIGVGVAHLWRLFKSQRQSLQP